MNFYSVQLKTDADGNSEQTMISFSESHTLCMIFFSCLTCEFRVTHLLSCREFECCLRKRLLLHTSVEFCVHKHCENHKHVSQQCLSSYAVMSFCFHCTAAKTDFKVNHSSAQAVTSISQQKHGTT